MHTWLSSALLPGGWKQLVLTSRLGKAGGQGSDFLKVTGGHRGWTPLGRADVIPIAGATPPPVPSRPPPDLSRKPRLTDALETSGLSPELSQVSATLRPGRLLLSPRCHHLQPSLTSVLLSFLASLNLEYVGIITRGVVQDASSLSVIATDVETQEQMSSNSDASA